MNLSLLILLAVFVVIAARKIGRVPVKIWHAMTAGAVLVLVTGQISLPDAMQAIDLDVMVFLFGMFVVVLPSHLSPKCAHFFQYLDTGTLSVVSP
jgi:Na+/H+ antiporter NhaD/arsenite permease-like protein